MSVEIYSRFVRPKSEQITFDDLPSMTEQHHKDDCDINCIAARYSRTGILPVNNRIPQFLDCSNAPADYAAAVRMMEEANGWFFRLPSELRSRFDNDPQQILNFMSDPANIAECQKLGLIAKPEPTTYEDEVVSNENTPEGSPAEQA